MSRPAPSRRKFLQWASGATGAAAVASPALAVAAESPELLDLGTRLEEAIRTYDEAQARFARVTALFDERQPEIPEAMKPTLVDKHWRVPLDTVRDIEGERAVRWEGHQPLYVVTSDMARLFLPTVDGRWRVARQLRRRLPAIEAYERRLEAFREEIGADSAMFARNDARATLGTLAKAIMETTSTTFQGLTIKARAIDAHARTERAGHTWVTHLYGKKLAADVLALSGRA